MMYKNLLKKRLFTVIVSMFFMLIFISLTLSIYFINDLKPFIKLLSVNSNSNEQQLVEPPNNNIYNLPESNMLVDVPLILQYPELPRGCEVTSLAMLLEYSGNPVDKLTLASEIEKDNSYYKTAYGRVFYGNPDHGFVGDMYSLSDQGFGVYHKPIFNLLSKYLPEEAIDLTGRKFEDTLYFLSKDIPVWVITNTKFNELSPDDFHVWYTSTVPIQITYYEHSVLLTGYDKDYIYFNDPLVNKINQKVPIEDFKKSWDQMGKQSVSYIPADKQEFFEFIY